VLATAGGPPHAIPVSTALRAGPRRVLLALSLRRASLARLREDPRVALTVLAAGLAFTAHGRASVLQEGVEGVRGVAAVAVDVDDVQDHDDPRYVVEEGVRWRWTDPEADARDEQVRAALRALTG
jgi:hypothetical protein